MSLEHALGQLRHLYRQMVIPGVVWDSRNAARHLLGPAIEEIERFQRGAPSPDIAPREEPPELCPKCGSRDLHTLPGLSRADRVDYVCRACSTTWRKLLPHAPAPAPSRAQVGVPTLEERRAQDWHGRCLTCRFHKHDQRVVVGHHQDQPDESYAIGQCCITSPFQARSDFDSCPRWAAAPSGPRGEP